MYIGNMHTCLTCGVHKDIHAGCTHTQNKTHTQTHTHTDTHRHILELLKYAVQMQMVCLPTHTQGLALNCSANATASNICTTWTPHQGGGGTNGTSKSRILPWATVCPIKCLRSSNSRFASKLNRIAYRHLPVPRPIVGKESPLCEFRDLHSVRAHSSSYLIMCVRACVLQLLGILCSAFCATADSAHCAKRTN